MEEKKDFKVPDHIIDIFKKKYESYPCITQTRNVTSDAIEVLTKKNKILWFNKYFDGVSNIIKEGVIDYSTTYKIMVYIKSKEREKIYNLYALSTNESDVNLNLLLKGLNKFYTIDII
jgi:hypothetical protein